MKQFITLPEMYEDLQARRIRKFGRVELLRIFNDGPPYWFVRIAGFNETRDRPRSKRCGSEFGNGYWRFVRLNEAEEKFNQFAMEPESIKEQRQASALREKQKQVMLDRIAAGKFTPFKKATE